MNRPLLLDLYCGAGGAAMGYCRAGFDVVGVDVRPQPRYPFTFICTDALDYLRHLIEHPSALRCDAIHASPPCQAHIPGMAAANLAMGRDYEHGDHIPALRALLRELGLPYVIENVIGARLLAPIQLCGSSFGLAVRRHRRFESNLLMMAPMCEHDRQREKRYWSSWTNDAPDDGYVRRLASVVQVYGHGGDKHLWGAAMGIYWMTTAELREAIPPAYTEHLGRQLMAHLGASVG